MQIRVLETINQRWHFVTLFCYNKVTNYLIMQDSKNIMINGWKTESGVPTPFFQ